MFSNAAGTVVKCEVMRPRVENDSGSLAKGITITNKRKVINETKRRELFGILGEMNDY